MAYSGWLNLTIVPLLMVILADLCSCEYFFPPSLRSSYYGNYLYRPRRYYYGHSRGYGSRWGRPGRDRLSSGLIKRAETYDENLISSLKNGNNDDSNERFIDKYSDDELKFIIQHILKASNDVDKRGFDRLTSGFIRRKRSPDADNENVKNKQRRKRSIDDIDTEPKVAESENAIQNDEDNVQGVEEAKRTDETFFAIQRNKKGFDRLASSFVKKSDSKDSIDSLADAVSGNENHVDKETAGEAENLSTKEGVSVEESAQIKTKLESSELDRDADGHDNIKRHFDRLASSFVKRRGFDRLTSGFVKRRGFDRLTSGFVKRRGFDRLTSGFVKKDDDKRRIDRLTSGFVKKDDEKRRGIDRLTSGFVKKNSDLDLIDYDETAEKRRFDRLTSGFVKKDNNKRYIDRMASGFVKKDNDKRGFDRLTSGFVKKDDDKRRFDRLTSGFVKKDADKRYFGRMNAGFVKKDADKRYFGRLNSGFVKKDKDDKRGFDRLTSGFVKKSNKINDMGNAYEGSYTYDQEGLENDIIKVGNYYNVMKGDNSENGEESDEIPNSGIWLPTDDSSNDQNEGDLEKRRIDRVAYGFIKRNDEKSNFVPEIGSTSSELQKRYFDRLTSGFVKKDQLQNDNLDKRRFDRLYSGFVKRPYSENPFIDRNKFDSENEVINDPSELYSSDSDVSKLLGGYGNKDVNMPEPPLNRNKRSIYGNDRGVFPWTGNGFVAGNGYDIDDDDYAMNHVVNDLQKRRLDRLMSGFVKKRSQFDNNNNLFDTIRHDTDNQRQAILPNTDDANYHLL